MKNLSKLCLFLFFAGFLAAPVLAAEIQGRVLSTSGNPIKEAFVYHRASGAQATTAEDGSFVISVEAQGRIILEVIHPDYADGLFSLSAKPSQEPVLLTLVRLIRQNEEIIVTASRFAEQTVTVPAATTVLPANSLSERLVPHITEALESVPGVVALGTGGFSIVPTIRGLARNRILIMVDNARIVSDRRTGPNASFISPEDIDRIEVVRSPSSVFYGSDAIGGVLQIFTKSAQLEGIHGTVHAGYGTNNKNAVYGLNLSGKKGPFSLFLSGQKDEAKNFSSPKAEVLRSSFNQTSLFGRATYETEVRRIDLSLLMARGKDIGKPQIDTPTKPTWYPRENDNLAQLRWTEKNLSGGELNFMAYANPNFLETRTNTITGYVAGKSDGYVSKEAYAKTESREYGLQMSYSKKLWTNFRLTGGIDLFGRGAVKAVNDETSFNASHVVTKIFHETPFTDGKRSDLGFYVSSDYALVKKVDVMGGVRFDVLSQSAKPGGGSETLSSKKNAVTGYFGISYRVTDRLTAFANISRAYRTPGLSELFYSGITGRGVIIAQPNLTPETSLNGDFGLRYVTSRFFAGAYAFLYSIDGLIDRFLVAKNTYTYGNLDDVRINGVEFELEYYPISGWKVFGNLFALKGESRATKLPINDISPLRLYLGSRAWIRTLSFEVSGVFQAKKNANRVGPAEIASGIPAYEYFQARVSYDFHQANVFCLVRNAFNKTYLARPDTSSVYEPGRTFIFGVRYAF